MSGFFLSMLVDVHSGSAKQRIEAVEAFDGPSANASARRYRVLVFGRVSRDEPVG